MSTAVQLVIDDPEKFYELTDDFQEKLLQGGMATVNVQAALTRKNAIEIVKEDFTLRNNFTTSQIQYTQMEKSQATSLASIQSTVGITEKAGYMAKQETGGQRKTESGANLAIPSNQARGGNKGSPVMKKHYLSKMKIVEVSASRFYKNFQDEDGNYRAKLVARAYVAHKYNLFMRHSDMLFRVDEFSKSGGEVNFKFSEIYNFKFSEVTNDPQPWLFPAMENPAKDVESIFISQMKKLGM